jgi:chromosome segregation ATPase
MRKRLMIALALASMLGLAACGDAGTDLESDISTAVDEVEPEVAAAVDQIETEIQQVADQIDASAVQAELSEAWEATEAELTEAAEAIRSGAEVNMEAVEQQIDEFEAELETVDVEQTVRDAWAQLQVQLDALMQQVS